MVSTKDNNIVCECGGRLNRYIEPRILLLLMEEDSYGYEIVEKMNARLHSLGGELDTATIYRKLRDMEREGLLISRWATSESGPPRRVYKITLDGQDRLYGWIMLIKERISALQQLVDMCESFCKKSDSQICLRLNEEVKK